MSEMCQDWLFQVIKINDKLFYRHYFVHWGHKLASFSTLVSNQYEKLKKKSGRVRYCFTALLFEK